MFKVDFVNLPVLKIVTEGHDTHFIYHMELPRPVEIEDGSKGPRVTIKEVLVVKETVGVTFFENFLVTLCLDKLPQS